ncbi:MAG: FG-GAP-like repeat-containing protein [bacterium]
MRVGMAIAGLVLAVEATSPGVCRAGTWTFTDVTTAAGFNYTHGFIGGSNTEAKIYAGGVACGDYDKDGWDDLFVVRGDTGANLLFRNLGNGTFQEVGAAAGVAQTGQRSNAPCFADMDGDGWLDLFVGGIETTEITVFKNLTNGTFQNVTASTGLVYTRDTYSAAFGDYDRDGDQDVFLAHFGSPQGTGNLWRNNGNFTFTDADSAAGIVVGGLVQYGFTPNWADINNDDWPDMLLVEDFGTTQVFLNDGDGTFTDITTPVITDEDGMGGTVGDYDNDGDLDWFVSSVWGTCCNKRAESSSRLLGLSGNRLYRNTGNGTFQNVTAGAGVSNGGWGWGASFQDFNNDGFLDIFHTNGYGGPQWVADSSRMYVSNANGTFTESALSLGLIDTKKGRGIACFDYDRDGDLDIFVSNNGQTPTFWRNDGGNAFSWLDVKLIGDAPNTEAAGARVYCNAIAGGGTFMREIRVGNNYLSQDPTVAHFGLQGLTSANEVRVEWPDGQVDIFNNVAANQTLVVSQGLTAVDLPSERSPVGAGVEMLAVSPNPVADETRFRYTLDRSAPVRLEIFDASGRSVRTLVDGTRAAGAHETQWDARDAAQRRVAAGLYLYRLESPGRTERGKVSVVR